LKTEMTETVFLSICNLIAQKHGITVDIVILSRVVNFVGDGDELACAFELEEILGRYAV